ncbi:hypothetical protein M8C21_016869 [Ambrosia artemisiifolia]|uniref:Uncharacterized protein n=1 Tax=Ambrosia artemisiifolia TaxID=4212 RepID=A0AAD5BLD5_AMBAR|nr:hypothetical protein M8C21_016869 [Ambrosia artemisiifolia]
MCFGNYYVSRNQLLQHYIQQEHTEMKSKRMSKAERSSLDIISTLPQNILETILCRLPTKEAARTSILSREWRYTWTKISKLEFYVLTRIAGQDVGIRLIPFYDILQVLLWHQGLIHEFSLFMYHSTTDQDSFDFDQVVLHLTKNHAVKKLVLQGLNKLSWHKLPKSVFSLHHLTDLDLTYFVLDYQPIFNGFGSRLRSLSLSNVEISTKTLLHLLSNCPSLKTLALFIGESHLGGKDCTVIELFKCLPMIEHLSTFGDVFEWLVLDSVPQGLPTLLLHLKYFCFKNMWFDCGNGLAFLLVLTKCSPNLKKIKLEINFHETCYKEHPAVVWEEYSDVWLEHLNELEIISFGHLKQEIEFVKFILARSPKLSKVSLRSMRCEKERLEMLQALLRAPRASHNLCLTVPLKYARSFR